MRELRDLTAFSHPSIHTEKNAIPGLYAAGNASGSFLAEHYPITIFGVSNSRASTFGRLAGFNAAAEKV